jgi:transcriptional regulator with XRE-family HTH domain
MLRLCLARPVTGARKVRPKPHASGVARLLLGIRRQRGWTQLDLANELKVSRETISRWERDTKEPHSAWRTLIEQFLERNGMDATLQT